LNLAFNADDSNAFTRKKLKISWLPRIEATRLSGKQLHPRALHLMDEKLKYIN